MAEKCVAITGLGVVAPSGIGIQEFWTNLLASRSAVADVQRFDATGFPCHIAGELVGFSARNYLPPHYRKAIKVMAPGTEIAVAAAGLAVKDSGLATPGANGGPSDVDPFRFACNIGSGLICQDIDELGAAVNRCVTDGRFDLKTWGREGIANLTPLWLLKFLPNMLSCHVTIIHGARGPSNTITCGDASALMAIGEASRQIGKGQADAAIAGGAESKLNLMGMLRQSFLKRLCFHSNGNPATACRPFDAAHDGTVIGEGGGAIILEDAALASRRGARVYADFAGCAIACDPLAIDVLRPTAGALHMAVKNALAAARISPQDVDLVVAHGTGVPGEDQAEAHEWELALGNRLDKIPAVTITGGNGSLFAGAGGVQVAVAAMAIHTGIVPPTVNFSVPADGCKLNLSPKAREAKIRYALAGAFTVGGQSCACVIRRHA